MQEWNDFYVATAGAAAALAGLLFVGISINLSKILEYPTLPVRAAVSLILLMSILLFSVILLIPQETIKVKGYIITILGSIVCAIITGSDMKMYRRVDKQYRRQALLTFGLDQMAVLPYPIGGIVLLISGGPGLYWVAAGFIFSFAKAVLDEWVLLIEILR